jgi:hypothetical protein
MKRLNFLPAVFFFLTVIILNSCTEGFEDINTNPNDPTSTNPDYIFNYIIKEGAGDYNYIFSYNTTYLNQWVMMTSTPWGNSTMPPYSLFQQTYIQNLWEQFYTTQLMNTEILLNLTSEDPEMVNKYQVARIWKVYCFHRVTDLWGDVPYSEALKALGGKDEIIMKPRYDTQESIYANMLLTLKDAVKLIDPAKPFFEYDMLFKKDLGKWIKFANSLQLRLAIRSGNAEVVNELLTENNLISSNEESALFSYPGEQDIWAPMYESRRTSPTAVPKISQLMALTLKENNDPRLAVYADPTESRPDTIIGVPNLMSSILKEQSALGIGTKSSSYIGSFFTRDSVYKNQVLTYSEVCFLKAEAVLRGWAPGSAETFYNDGVRASMRHYKIAENVIDTFLVGPAKYNGTLEQIITQKWVALYMNGIEAFAEYRRTGYPQMKKYDLVLNGIKIVSKTWVDVPKSYIPSRLPYPEDEKMGLNSENYTEAVNRPDGLNGEDTYFAPVWFIKRAEELK